MFGSTRNTLVTYLALVLAMSAVQANSDFQRVHRDHVNLGRMVKKRQIFTPVIGAGLDPAERDPVSTTTPVVTTTTGTAAASASSLSISSSGIPNIINSILSDTGALPSSILSLSQSSVSASSSASVSSTSSSSSTSSTPTTPAQATTPPPAPIFTSSSSAAKPTITVVQTNNAAEETEIPKPTGAAQTKSTTLMVLIIIASSIGGIAILWTIFRKWKLGRSSKFDERLQPIDWQPTDDRNDGIIPAHRRAPSNASSFHSASAHGHNGRVNSNGGTSNLQPIPDHDFTAGVAPIGGYADLARGPSPPMGEVNRGAALGRGYEYDNGVPLHHQAGGAYGAYDYQGSRY